MFALVPFSPSSHAPTASAQGQLVCLLVASHSLLPLQCGLALSQSCYSMQSMLCQPCHCDIASSEHRCLAWAFTFLTDLCAFRCLVSRQSPLLQLCNVLRAHVHRLAWAPCTGDQSSQVPGRYETSWTYRTKGTSATNLPCQSWSCMARANALQHLSSCLLIHICLHNI